MVDYHDMRALGLAARPMQEAQPIGQRGTLVQVAGFGLGADPLPRPVLAADEQQFGAVAGIGGGQPDQTLDQQLDFAMAQFAQLSERRPAAQAEVVAAALD